MQLTEPFSLEELIASEVAARKDIDNTPPDEVLANLRILAAGLEQVRAVLGKPIHVSSGYRCAELNAAIGGSKDSMHMQGPAADIICPGFGPPLEVCRAIAAAGIVTDQIIHEFGRWTHIAFPAPGKQARNAQLTIANAAKGYQPGLNPSA
ncbi:MAG: peptidase M15 [Candidatus Rokubacteria bacterium]|nr:peptidase M15 [Candidatus Rokubacteria bacterium]